jgi:hypothetical protein
LLRKPGNKMISNHLWLVIKNMIKLVLQEVKFISNILHRIYLNK